MDPPPVKDMLHLNGNIMNSHVSSGSIRMRRFGRGSFWESLEMAVDLIHNTFQRKISQFSQHDANGFRNKRQHKFI